MLTRHTSAAPSGAPHIRPLERIGSFAVGDLESERPLSELLNERRPVDTRVTVGACVALAVVYSLVSVLPLLAGNVPPFPGIRACIVAYLLIGARYGNTMSWNTVRVYATGITLLLPLSTAYIAAAQGYPIHAVAFTVLAAFLPQGFQLIGRDLLRSCLAMCAGFTTIVVVMPPAPTDVIHVTLLFCSSAIAGAAVALMVMIYRSLMFDSIGRAQASYVRERVLREFAETTTSTLQIGPLLQGLGLQFQETLDESWCCFVGADDATRTDRASGCQGPHDPSDTGAVSQAPPPFVRSIATEARSGGRPVLLGSVSADDVGRRGGNDGLPFPVRGAVAFPLSPRVALVLVTPRPIDISNDAVETWQAMVRQAAIALTNAEAWLQLRDQEERSRQLAEEQAHMAELKARFVAQASHEFRTPLAVIRAATDTIQRYRDRMTPEQIEARIEKIQRSLHDMSELLDEVLAFGRADAVGFDCTPQPTVVADLCREILDDVRANTTAAHRLVLSCDDRIEARVDHRLLRRILGNLLTNAVKYTPHGGTVRLEVDREDRGIALRVRDEGIGISADDQAHLFEPFQRGTNVEGIEGAGLGLAITKNAVAAHGGEITVDSTIGQGTTFTVHLPGA